jgi:aryl-alcohol dehydrogenase-like predicted oxidoreductase
MPQDDFRRNAKQYQEPLLSRNLELAELLKQIGARHGVIAGVVAIAWTLHNPAVTAAIVERSGVRRDRQVPHRVAVARTKV